MLLLLPSALSCPHWAPQLVQSDPSQRGSTLLADPKWSPMPWRPALPPSAAATAFLAPRCKRCSRCRRHRRCCCSHVSITSSHLTVLLLCYHFSFLTFLPPLTSIPTFVPGTHFSPDLPFKDLPPSSPFPPLFILGANVMESQRCMTAGLWANAPAGDIIGSS